jgi:guanylate kinase
MNKIIVCGGGCSGKNFLRDRMVAKGFIPDVSITTRDLRPGEKVGEDYDTVTVATFKLLIEKKEFVQWFQNGEHFYGTSKTNWDHCDIFIMTPGGIAKLDKYQRKTAFIIYLDIDAEIRTARMRDRGWNDDQISSRLQVDRQLFDGFADYDIKVTGELF